ncbi:aldo/keto reductase [Paenibacillus antri]|uniref:Aldo/keto reductase n=1 Tax=Paenibacillus antri TaxID=2582848 RepID=A0A5R9GKW6_9BACL|nr:aldo/keto reductase [Paenibacillus antri]TLS53683.1 aldo/keto reductase [Paenibacillus antri]
MHYRVLGKSGLRISEVGFGAWGIGKTSWVGAEDDESLRSLHLAIDLGLNFIDTAMGYGNGHSERLVGEVVKSRSEEIYVATKVSPINLKWPAPAGTAVQDAFTKEHMIACAENSLRNLGTETIDLLQTHVWLDDWTDQGDWLEGVERLKEQGKIRAFGISINDHDADNALQAIRSGVVDAVQFIYNVFDQAPEEKLLPLCMEMNVGTIVRVPLDEGGLTGQVRPDTTFPEGDFRNGYFRDDRKREVFERVTAIADDLGATLERTPEIALRFILSHPGVSTVIPGMLRRREVEMNCALGDGRGLPEEQVRKLKKHAWPRNFYK